jgi:protein-disulfide isomerase
MKLPKLTGPLLGMTLVLQGAILYVDWHNRSNQRANRPSGQPEPIQTAEPNTVVNVAGLPALGKEDAKVVIVEFSDFECPFCIRHATSVFPQLKEQWVATGKLRYVAANNPLPMHSHARLLATASLCADQQNRYWDMHDVLFSKQPKTTEEVLSIAHDLSLNGRTFASCLEENQQLNERLNNEIEVAQKLGLQATPGFAVGFIDQDTVHIKKFIRGAQPVEIFSRIVEELLRSS